MVPTSTLLIGPRRLDYSEVLSHKYSKLVYISESQEYLNPEIRKGAQAVSGIRLPTSADYSPSDRIHRWKSDRRTARRRPPSPQLRFTRSTSWTIKRHCGQTKNYLPSSVRGPFQLTDENFGFRSVRPSVPPSA